MTDNEIAARVEGYENILAMIEGLSAQIATVTAERDAAIADNAQLLHLARSAVECVRGLIYQDGTDAALKKADRWMHGFEKELGSPHPGAPLLAERDKTNTALTDLIDHIERLFGDAPETAMAIRALVAHARAAREGIK